MLSRLLSQFPLLSSLLNLTPLGHTNQLPLTPSIHTSQCPNPPPLSCPFPPPRSIDSCCLNHPSGHFLQTQFWDTAPALGPNTSWTIHGLWPDLCAGGFDQFCDDARSHEDIRAVLQSINPTITRDLLAYMDAYWLSLDGRDNHLWSHEWNKHGTCISTLDPGCYADENPDLAVLDYFVHATSLFQTLDTFSVLAEAGILPSDHERYSLSELEEAVEFSPHGYPVTFRCHSGELNEVWYHFSVKGSLRNNYDDGTHQVSSPFLNATTVNQIFVPTDPDGAKSNCPARGIRYLPKSKSPGGGKPRPSPTRTTTSATSTPTSPPFTGKGNLVVHVIDDDLSNDAERSASTQKGCLIRLGYWYLSGTCATFKAQADVVDPGHSPLFSLSSSYSPCFINPGTGRFECTKATAVQSIFSSDSHDPTVLSYHNSTIFYADHVPQRFDKVDIYADDGDGTRNVQLEINWVPS
ncbi:ribonuclease T2 [Exophiala viscosa]|uniref:ribonuclease T2 n=1 Tax=Exophiala viscosa TaxID=2486360 RepID=UPI00219DDD99|nr:ribonuclease T2 [Exophiala viscosa]